MFGRRKPLSPGAKVRYIFLPQGGWKRFATYIVHRLKRLPGSPTRIASGFAFGAAVSFTPFIGFHFVLAAAFAALFRGNIVASAFGTAVGNPWTFPFIWIWTYEIGIWILGVPESKLPESFAFEYIFENPLAVFLPMLIGSLPLGISAWLIAFFPLRYLVERYQIARQHRLERRRLKLARKQRAALSKKSAVAAQARGQ